MKPASTIQDDIPPVHVLEAAERQDRKETEDLLSGFDRPGRGPKSAPKERDFVDYYAKKPGSSGSGPGRTASGAERAPVVIREKVRDEATVIVRRNRDAVPGWVVFGGAALLMLLVGGLVAYVATADGRPDGAGAAAGASAASAATTLTGATTGKPTAADDNIPPPAPVTASAAVPEPEVAPGEVAAAPSPSTRGSAAKREPKAAQSGAPSSGSAAAPRATTAAEAPKAAPREDFIRDL